MRGPSDTICIFAVAKDILEKFKSAIVSHVDSKEFDHQESILDEHIFL